MGSTKYPAVTLILNSSSDAYFLLVDFEDDLPVGRILRFRYSRGASSSFSPFKFD